MLSNFDVEQKRDDKWGPRYSNPASVLVSGSGPTLSNKERESDHVKCEKAQVLRKLGSKLSRRNEICNNKI